MNTRTDQQKAAIKLIDGIFTADEAQEIILSLIQAKIHFHEINNFASLEQTGTPDAIAQYRISELQAERKKVLEFIRQANQKPCMVKVTSTISVEFMDEGR